MRDLLLGVLLLTALDASALDGLWQREGAGDSSRYGFTLLPLGDQNDDGYADWAVFAKGGPGDPPRLEFFHGGPTPPPAPYRTVQGLACQQELMNAQA